MNYDRYEPFDFWDAQKRASILIQRARFNNTRQYKMQNFNLKRSAKGKYRKIPIISAPPPQ